MCIWCFTVLVVILETFCPHLSSPQQGCLPPSRCQACITSCSSSGSPPSLTSVKMLHLLLHIAQLLQEPLPTQLWGVWRRNRGEGQEDGQSGGNPGTTGPSMGWGSPWSRGRKGQCWVFHPQRPRELLMGISEEALR